MTKTANARSTSRDGDRLYHCMELFVGVFRSPGVHAVVQAFSVCGLSYQRRQFGHCRSLLFVCVNCGPQVIRASKAEPIYVPVLRVLLHHGVNPERSCSQPNFGRLTVCG